MSLALKMLLEVDGIYLMVLGKSAGVRAVTGCKSDNSTSIHTFGVIWASRYILDQEARISIRNHVDFYTRDLCKCGHHV